MSLPHGFYEAAHQFGWMLSPSGTGFMAGSPFSGDSPSDPNWPVFLRLKTVPTSLGLPSSSEMQRLPRDVWYGGPMPRKDAPYWDNVFKAWAVHYYYPHVWVLSEVIPIAPEFRGYAWPTRDFHWYTATERAYPGRYQYVMSSFGTQPGQGWYKVA